jgi:predicted dehydrogenase
MPSKNQNIKLVGVPKGRNPERAVEISDKWGIPLYDSLGTMLKKSEPDLILACSKYLKNHFEQALKALEYGISGVIMEKETINREEKARRLINLANENKSLLASTIGYALNRPPIIALHKLLQEDKTATHIKLFVEYPNEYPSNLTDKPLIPECADSYKGVQTEGGTVFGIMPYMNELSRLMFSADPLGHKIKSLEYDPTKTFITGADLNIEFSGNKRAEVVTRLKHNGRRHSEIVIDTESGKVYRMIAPFNSTVREEYQGKKPSNAIVSEIEVYGSRKDFEQDNRENTFTFPDEIFPHHRLWNDIASIFTGDKYLDKRNMVFCVDGI